MTHSPTGARPDETFRNGLHSGAGALTRSGDAGEAVPPPAPTTATEEWVNEGGSVRPPHRAASFAFARRSQKAPSDTAGGCRERAASDLMAAVAMETANGRLKLEHSAASWTARADMLQRLDDSFETRRSAAFADWQKEEAREALGQILEPAEPQHLRL